MKKFAKISSIIITAFLTFINVYKLIPSDNAIRVLIGKVICKIKSITYLENFIYVILLILGFFVILNIFSELKNISTTHKLKEGSHRFYRFFAKWYGHSGTLSIICDDIDWISDGKDTRILDVLIKKSRENNLNLYLLRKDTYYASMLINEGAKAYSASQDIISNYSFSCISFMGNNSSVIVREKQNDHNNEIKFNEISSNYVSSLLNALIKEGQHNGLQQSAK